MKLRSINSAAASTATLFLVSAFVFASPAAAGDGPTMPNLKGMNLQAAADAVDVATKEMIAATAPDIQKKLADRLTVHPVNVKGPKQDVYNYSNWYVCWQSPKADVEITPKAWVTVGVRRPNTKCW